MYDIYSTADYDWNGTFKKRCPHPFGPYLFKKNSELMMSKSVRESLSIETRPWKCPQCYSTERFCSLPDLKKHWSLVHSHKKMPTFQASASNGMILGTDFVKPKPIRREMKKSKKKTDASTQRNEVSFAVKMSFKNLPVGWSREKVAKAYHKAGKRGGKGKFLELWTTKYDFKLSQQKTREWEKFVLNQEEG